MITRKQLELLHYHFFPGPWLIVKEERGREKVEKNYGRNSPYKNVFKLCLELRILTFLF